MFCRFHIVEEICVMDDARHVGFVELDHALDFELVRHERILRLGLGKYDGKNHLEKTSPCVQMLAFRFSKARRVSLAIAVALNFSNTALRPASPKARDGCGFNNKCWIASA